MVIFLALFNFSKIFALTPDLEAKAALRSYPLGGGVSVEVGLKQLVWGEEAKSREPQPWQGYLRPFIQGDFAPYYSGGFAGVEVFPLGFLGLRSAVGEVQNHEDYEAYKCSELTCRNKMGLSYWEADFIAGAWKIFIFLRYGEFTFEPDKLYALPVIEPETGVRIYDQHERFMRGRGGIGARLTDEYLLVLMGAQMISKNHDGDTSENAYLIFTRAWENIALSLGAGYFRSTVLPSDFSSLLRIDVKF